MGKRTAILKNSHMTARFYQQDKDRIIELRDKEFLGALGNIVISTNQKEETLTVWKRSRKTGLNTLKWQDGTELSLFASEKEDVLVYESKSPDRKQKVDITFLPEKESTYKIFQLSGVFFVCYASRKTEGKADMLCGKLSLHTDGFPTADDTSLHIKDASRVKLYVKLATDLGEVEESREKRMLNVQMRMNRQLTSTESRKVEPEA